MSSMKRIAARCRRTTVTLLIVITATGIAMTCGDDNGSGPTGYGSVTGIVRVPFDLTAEFQPAAGVTVRLTGGDYDSSVVTGEDGVFLFEEVPNLQMTLSAEQGPCFTVAGVSVTAIADETVTQDLTLASADPGECFGLPRAGAARMEVNLTGDAAVLLYPTGSGTHPALAVFDLVTGEGAVEELADLDAVYDIKLIAADLGILNYKSAAGYGLRFFHPASLSLDGDDVIYVPAPLSGTHEPGRLTCDDLGQTVFVTHGTRQLANVSGMVFAVSVSGRTLIDADDDDGDGLAAFDNDLVNGTLNWAFNIAFDPDAGEILVANRQITIGVPPTVTAIDWTQWGSFDRDGGLSAPTEGVRVIDMDPGTSGFGVEFWDFTDGYGVAAHQNTPILLYESGGESFTPPYHTEVQIDLRSSDLVLKILPERQSWFALVFKPSTGKKAVEEWTLSTLERHHRYESRFPASSGLVPRAFTVDGVNARLYVAYVGEPVLEIFDLCEPGECIAPGR
ncbi:MAG TPA: carboxypeptidase-like regulatory domain-containing protein [Acidobacteriota bacterium]|nr:carboxypeptidase-like regulatory domain-containing protein [Acidobacteriota bacterium]